MDARQMQNLLRNLDRRTERIERILPTLATKEELSAAIAPLATKEELRAAVAPLATREEMHAAIQAAIAPLATREEMRAAIHEAVAPLATKAELREEGERTRRHFEVVAESLRSDIRTIAEGYVALEHRVTDQRVELKQDMAGLDARVTRLEVSEERRQNLP